MSLYDLYEGMSKHADDHGLNVNDEWAETAAQYGMTTEQLMDKLAEEQVREEVAMMKTAQEATYLGKCMGAGYFDALAKVASADPVRDGVPEIHIKVAQAGLEGLVHNMVKAGNAPMKAEAILAALKNAGGQAMGKADDALLGLQARTGLGQRGKLVDEARGILGGKTDTGFGSKAADLIGLSGKERGLRGIQSQLGVSGQGGWSKKSQGIKDLVNSNPKLQDQLRGLLQNMGNKAGLSMG